MSNLVKWTCPECGEENEDLPYDTTYCAACNEVVYVFGNDGDIDDEHRKIDPDLIGKLIDKLEDL
jgi:hypothetical protein